MELVEGETLAMRLERGALKLEQALAFALRSARFVREPATVLHQIGTRRGHGFHFPRRETDHRERARCDLGNRRRPRRRIGPLDKVTALAFRSRS